MLDNIKKESPLIIYFLMLSLGIFLNNVFDVTLFMILSISILFLLVTNIFDRILKMDWFYFILIILLGMIASSRYNFKSTNHLSNFDFPSENYQISGRILSRRVYPDKIKIILNNVKIENKLYSGKILTTIKKPSIKFYNNDTIQYVGNLYLPTEAKNPGEFNYKHYLNKKNIYLLSFLQKKSNYLVAKSTKYSIINFADKVKEKIISNIDIAMEGESANILKALIVGARDELDGKTTEIFVHSGTIHILAVSGLHVAYVTLSLFVIFSFLRIKNKPRTILMIFGLLFYIVIVDFKPSVIRAVIMASVLLFGQAWEKPVNIYNSLATAGFIQLLISPMQLFDAGFQLSFSAVFSIVYFNNRLKVIIPEKYQPYKLGIKPIKYLYQLLLVSFAAFIGTIPITAYYFNRIAPIGLFANLFAIPIIGFVGAAGFAQVILGMLIPSVNIFYGQVNQILLIILHRLTFFTASIPFGSIDIPNVTFVHIFLFYFFIFALFNLEKRIIKVSLIFGLLLILNINIWSNLFDKPKLEVIFFDVGQGDATLVKFPSGEKILIDAADNTFSRNYAKDILLPYFRRKNIKHLDVLALSHPHSDHIGGAPFLMSNISIGEIWESDVEANSKVFHRIQYLSDSLKIPIKKIFAGDYFNFGECDIFILHPSKKYVETEPHGFNNYSTTFKLTFKDFDVLFTGDIEKESEEYIELYNEFINCEILKVPHHGSKTSSTESFLRTVKPELAYISVGRKNKFKHPFPKTIERYLQNNIIIHRSDLQHSLVVESDGNSYQIVE